MINVGLLYQVSMFGFRGRAFAQGIDPTERPVRIAAKGPAPCLVGRHIACRRARLIASRISQRLPTSSSGLQATRPVTRGPCCVARGTCCGRSPRGCVVMTAARATPHATRASS